MKFKLGDKTKDIWFGGLVSEYEFNRIKKIIELHPSVLEYNRLGRLEKI